MPQTAPDSEQVSSPARFFVIGAGSRGGSYSRAIKAATNGIIVGVAEPNDYKRQTFCKAYGINDVTMAFTDWRDMVTEEGQKRLEESGGVDGMLICTLDHTHVEIAKAIIPLGYHVLCEKPLATSYRDCLTIQALVEKHNVLFAVGHVLRYSPHNLLLKRLICDDKIIGDVVAIEHTEPVGWYHFAHSYVRGNWHKESTSAPSILTKCCHDLDLLLWLLCSPTPYNPSERSTVPHLPASVYSAGALTQFKPSRKPATATNNCTTCPSDVERSCIYSAKKIYIESKKSGFAGAYNTRWPVDIVYPEVNRSDISFEDKKKQLLSHLAKGPYGRCVYDGHNDVVDNQVVVMSWDEDTKHKYHYAKTATLTMTAFSHNICERRTRIYGTTGEIHSDTALPSSDTRSKNARFIEPNTSLRSISFIDEQAEWKSHAPSSVDLESGHGGGDTGLTRAFVEAVEAVKKGNLTVDKAQREILGGGVDEVVRAHGMAFAAEQSRKERQTLKWNEWDECQRQTFHL